MYQQARQERPLGELFGELSEELRTLVRQEIELARVEISDRVADLGMDAAYMAGAAAVAFVAFQALVATAVIGLSYLVPWWLSTLIVGVVLGVAAYLLLQRGLNDIRRRGVVPTETVRSLKEDKEWLQDQIG